MSINQKHDEQRRVTSITRKLHWYMLRGKIWRFLVSDLLLAAFLTAGWCAEQEYSALGQVLAQNHRSLEL